MHRSLRVLMLTALAVLSFAGATAAADARTPRGFVGVVFDREIATDGELIQAVTFAQMAQSGVESVRTTFNWAAAQPRRGQAFNFGHTDSLVRQATRRRIQVLPVVMYAPEWARDRKDRGSAPPAGTAGYARYSAALVGRYGPRGSFWRDHPELPKRPIRTWQIWNEPHLTNQWDNGTPGVAAKGWAKPYTKLLVRAGRAIKRRDRGAKVVLAGLTSDSWRQLARIYRAGGRRAFDVVAVHTYTYSPLGAVRIVKKVRAVTRRARQPRIPIWVTEAAWPAARGRAVLRREERPLVTDDAGMARRLTQVYELMVQRRKKLGVQRVFWYSWASPYRGGHMFDYAGLGEYAGSGFRARPALAALVRVARKLQGCAKTDRGTCRR